MKKNTVKLQSILHKKTNFYEQALFQVIFRAKLTPAFLVTDMFFFWNNYFYVYFNKTEFKYDGRVSINYTFKKKGKK